MKVEFKYVNQTIGNFWAWLPNGKSHELAGDYYPAADYEALESKLDRMRKALESFSSYFPENLDEVDDDNKTGVRYITPDPLLRIRDIRKLREALEASDG